MKRCPLYQRYKHVVEMVAAADDEVTITSVAEAGFGQTRRWKTAIPTGAHIVFKGYTQAPRLAAVYAGNGNVVDLESGNEFTLHGWCVEVHERRLMNRSTAKLSAPQNCSVLMQDNQEVFAVRLKLFDYVRMETLDANHAVPVNFVFYRFNDDDENLTVSSLSPVVPQPIRKRPLFEDDGGIVDRYERELGILGDEYYAMDSSSDGIVEVTVEDDDNNQPLLLVERGGRRSSSFQKRCTEATKLAASVPYPVAFGGSELDKRKGFQNKSHKHQIWYVFYGRCSTATCIVCGIKTIERGWTDHECAHVNPRSSFGANDETYNRVYSCADCNRAAGTANLLDHLHYTGRLCVAGIIVDALLWMYCESKPYADVTFANRCDFVRRIFGVEPAVPGGVKHEAVFQALAARDQSTPLAPHMCDPRAYQVALAARLHELRHVPPPQLLGPSPYTVTPLGRKQNALKRKTKRRTIKK